MRIIFVSRIFYAFILSIIHHSFTCLLFTLRQTPHMSLPLPQVPPPTIDVPQPDPPVVAICNTWFFPVALLQLSPGGCAVITPGFWQVGVPHPMPGEFGSMQVGQTSCCITWNDYLPFLPTRRHLVLTRLPTTNGLGHFVALLLVLNPVVDSGHFLTSENITDTAIRKHNIKTRKRLLTYGGCCTCSDLHSRRRF